MTFLKRRAIDNVIKLINRLVFFIGWLLSPLTTWNDIFVNIPLAYICASLFVKAFPWDFSILLIIFYWLTNIIGLLLMYLSGRGILRENGLNFKSVILTLFAYSIILLFLDKFIALRPIFVR